MNAFKPQMQQLEAREVPATFSLTGGTLTIAAASAGSTVVINSTATPGKVTVNWSDAGTGAFGTATETGVNAIVFNGSSVGVDQYTNNTSIKENVNGSGSAEDIIYSGYGVSTVNASNGTNLVVSRALTSTVTCGTGYDMVLNYGGHMTVNADPPGDYIYNP